MSGKKRQVHEPDAELAGAEDAIEDATRLTELGEQRVPSMVFVRVPLESLLQANDSLNASELRQIQWRVAERLAEIGTGHQP